MGKSPHPDDEEEILDEDIDHHEESVGWEVIQFFLLVVAVEHLIILLKNLIHFRSSVPAFISQGIIDRQKIKIEYKQQL